MISSHKLYSSLPELTTHKIWAEIDLDALRHNYRLLSAEIKKSTPECRPMCVVKADAYGHGIDVCVETLIDEGCDFFAVSSIEEALAVRQVCRSQNSPADILILGYTPAEEAPTLSKCNIVQTVFSLDYARRLSERLSKVGRSLRVHFKFDTGMNRIGFPAHTNEDVEASARQIHEAASLPGIIAEGAFTHFARADETEGESRTRLQAERYFDLLEHVKALGTELCVRHMCNSAATVRFPEYRLELCRLGILLYGAEPSSIFDLPIKPVLRLCAQISQIHTLRCGEQLSYGGTFTADRDMRIATVPIGYADGFVRAYTGARAVIYSSDGKRKGEGTVIGRICMDQCMLSLGDTPAAEGDTAVFIGENGQLDELAALAHTINYECLCLVSARVVRVLRTAPEDQGTIGTKQ